MGEVEVCIHLKIINKYIDAFKFHASMFSSEVGYVISSDWAPMQNLHTTNTVGVLDMSQIPVEL